MRLVNIDKIKWRATSHGTPCIYKEDIDNLPYVDAISMNKVRKMQAEIDSYRFKNKADDNSLNLALMIIEGILNESEEEEE